MGIHGYGVGLFDSPHHLPRAIHEQRPASPCCVHGGNARRARARFGPGTSRSSMLPVSVVPAIPIMATSFGFPDNPVFFSDLFHNALKLMNINFINAGLNRNADDPLITDAEDGACLADGIMPASGNEEECLSVAERLELSRALPSGCP